MYDLLSECVQKKHDYNSLRRYPKDHICLARDATISIHECFSMRLAKFPSPALNTDHMDNAINFIEKPLRKSDLYGIV